VIVAKEVQAGPKPYGIGFEFEIPPIPTLPGAAYASVETNYFTIGSQHVAYYQNIHGKQKLVHVKGLIVPKTCPKGGFPFKIMISFLDGTSTTDTYTVLHSCYRRLHESGERQYPSMEHCQPPCPTVTKGRDDEA
jgi:hypothetical protein